MVSTPSAVSVSKALLASSVMFWMVTIACQTFVVQMGNVWMVSIHLAVNAAKDSQVDCVMFWLIL
jgi:hypothetical protein